MSPSSMLILLLASTAPLWSDDAAVNAFTVQTTSRSHASINNPQASELGTRRSIHQPLDFRLRNQRSSLVTSLNLVTESPLRSHEEEKEKKKSNNNNNNKKDDDNEEEWTESGGGFIPNILRRRGRRKQTKEEQKQKQPTARPKPIIEPVMTVQEYKDAVVDEPNKIVIVKFFASWCRSCRAVAPHFEKLSATYSPHNVKFVEVPLTKENAYLHEGLGVPSVPFAHIYYPGVGLVEEMKMNKKDFSNVKKVLATYVAGECEIPEDGEEDVDGIGGVHRGESDDEEEVDSILQ